MQEVWPVVSSWDALCLTALVDCAREIRLTGASITYVVPDLRAFVLGTEFADNETRIPLMRADCVTYRSATSLAAAKSDAPYLGR